MTALAVRLEDAEGHLVERGYQVEAINPPVVLTSSLRLGATGIDYSLTMAGSGGRTPRE